MKRRRAALIGVCFLVIAAAGEGEPFTTPDLPPTVLTLEQHVDNLLLFASDTSGTRVGTPTAYWAEVFPQVWPHLTFSPPTRFDAVDGRFA